MKKLTNPFARYNYYSSGMIRMSKVYDDKNNIIEYKFEVLRKPKLMGFARKPQWSEIIETNDLKLGIEFCRRLIKKRLMKKVSGVDSKGNYKTAKFKKAS